MGIMKRALIRVRLGYRKWVRYINGPASTKKPTITEYILLGAVASAIVIKFKGQIEEKIFESHRKENFYYRYYDYVGPEKDIFKE